MVPVICYNIRNIYREESMSETNNKPNNVNENTPKIQEDPGEKREVRSAKPNNRPVGYNNRNNRNNQGNRNRKPNYNNRYNKEQVSTEKDQNQSQNQAQNSSQAQIPNQNQNQNKQGAKKQEFYSKQPRNRGQKGGKGYVKYNRQVMPGETVEDIADDITRIEKELVIEIEEISHVAL